MKEKNSGAATRGMTYYIVTFGCQMNEHDSEVISALLEKEGYHHAGSAEEADLIVINTCAVRKKPEDKVASLLGKYEALKAAKPTLCIAVGGCMAQQEQAALYLKERFHHLDLIFGTHALPRLPALLKRAQQKKSTVVDTAEDYENREGLPISRQNPFQAWLPVSYGCDNYCSYCVVPYVRGRERSRPLALVREEFLRLVNKKTREVTLLGQNVNSYGRDLPGQPAFAALLKELDALSSKTRIRFLTSHPKDLSWQLVEAVAEGRHICEHFHLPVQSGSDRVLKMMNRGYTRSRYLELLELIRKRLPEAAITTDIIVGFPGEEEADFLETLALVEEARFDNAFSFIYSPRPGTAAAGIKECLTRAEKEERLKHLNKNQHLISRQINEKLEGRKVEVLVEGASKNDPGRLTGRTRTNKLVHFSGGKAAPGDSAFVRITEARTWNLLGEALE